MQLCGCLYYLIRSTAGLTNILCSAIAFYSLYFPGMEDHKHSDSSTENLAIDCKSLIFRAIKYDDVELLTSLICDKKISPNFYKDETAPICKAAALGNVAILAVLLHGNCILNVPDINDAMWHRQPIHIAASKGHVHFVRVLVENGVNVDEVDRDNRTALHWAAVFGQHEVIKYLISAGASVNAVQADGYTALHAASCFGHSATCQALLEGNADIQQSDKDGWKVYHSAACYGHLDVVKVMVERSIDINTETSDQETMLHFAASSGQLATVKYLIEQGIDINGANANGFTPFHLGVFHNRYNVCKYLAENGANIQTRNKQGQSPCHHVAVKMDERFLLLLMRAGYNFSSETWIHEDAFPISSVKNCDKVYKMMKYLASNCHSLKDLCCFRIRQILCKDYKVKVQSLVLPTLLKDMISYKDMSE